MFGGLAGWPCSSYQNRLGRPGALRQSPGGGPAPLPPSPAPLPAAAAESRLIPHLVSRASPASLTRAQPGLSSLRHSLERTKVSLAEVVSLPAPGLSPRGLCTAEL